MLYLPESLLDSLSTTLVLDACCRGGSPTSAHGQQGRHSLLLGGLWSLARSVACDKAFECWWQCGFRRMGDASQACGGTIASSSSHGILFVPTNGTKIPGQFAWVK